MDTMTGPRKITPICWQLPTETPGEGRFYFITAQFWTHSHHPNLSPVLIVASIHTFHTHGDEGYGQFAAYIGSPPAEVTYGADVVTFEMVEWVAQYGTKLTEAEAAGFRAVSPAPNGIKVEYRR